MRHNYSRLVGIVAAVLVGLHGLQSPVLGAATLTPSTQISPPRHPVVTERAANQLTIEWSGPLIGSELVEDFEVRFSRDGGANWTTFDDGKSTSFSVTVTGLQRGNEYVMEVRAVGGNASSSWMSVDVNHMRYESVAAGSNHTCALRTDGKVKCWGENGSGQLGDGTTTQRLTPTTVTGIFNATAITAGGAHTCALMTNSTIKCWGFNWNAQLGDGTTTQRLTPVAVTGITNATAITADGAHTCALLADATVKCWGSNSSGQLGDGTTTQRLTPVAVTGITNATSITAGSNHTCALLTDGTVNCWGSGGSGQLGDGTTTQRLTPVAVTGITNATSVTAGYDHTCALLVDGTVKCWGSNLRGELGDGTTTNGLTPVAVTGINNASAVSAGGRQSCALKSGVSILCWGVDGWAPQSTYTTPFGLLGVGHISSISLGHIHTCAVTTVGSVKCRGQNQSGQLGSGTNSEMNALNSVQQFAQAMPASVTAGSGSTCAVLTDSTVKCWGEHWNAGLGDGTIGQETTPIQVSSIDSAILVGVGESHACALLADGAVKCWGGNDSGQLGDGTTAQRLTPVAVTGINNATAINAGGYHTCALLADGTVKCWGDNDSGQLGDGTTAQRLTPVAVTGINNATAITSGIYHTCALLADGTVKCWGGNSSGQLGDGTIYTKRLTPTTVTGLSNATAITSRYIHTCALLADSNVKCWGDNDSKQLGDGTYTTRRTPTTVTVSGLASATAITAGGGHTCALLADSTTKCWGTNGNGQSAPANNVRAITAGGAHTCALHTDDSISCWGFNGHGALGDGTNSDRGYGVKVTVFGEVHHSLPSAPVSVYPPRLDESNPRSIGISYPDFNGDGLPILLYKVEWAQSEGTWASVTTTRASQELANLEPGTTYKVRVSAQTAAGWGSPTEELIELTPSTRPDAVTNVTASAGDGQATISWTASSANGSPITSYTVTWNGGSKTCTSPCTITGLTNGTNYTFTVIATNAIGDSDPATSNTVNPRAAATRPDAPTNVTASAGEGQATITWTVASANGSPITSHLVSWTGGSKTCTSPCTIIGLTNGTNYTFTVIATNAIGDSGPATSNTVTPKGKPGTPTNVSANSGDGQAIVSWIGSSANGSPITSYTVTWNGGSKTCTSPCTITGLTNGTNYTFTVIATNAIGDSDPATSNPVVPKSVVVAKAPGKVTSIKGVSAVKKNTISWNAAAANGSAISKYEIKWKLSTSKTWSKWISTGKVTRAVISSWLKGKKYQVQVRATNAKGSSLSAITTITQTK